MKYNEFGVIEKLTQLETIEQIQEIRERQRFITNEQIELLAKPEQTQDIQKSQRGKW